MTETFNPYLKWLGIRQPGSPPNHYALLGLELFEPDPEVISNAADQRMAHVRTFAAGPQSALSQRVLNELATARVDLLDNTKRAAYDAALRQRLPQAAPVRPVTRPVAEPRPLAVPRAVPVAPRPDLSRGGSGPRGRERVARSANNVPLILGIGCAAAVVGGLMVILLMRSPQRADKAIAQQPAPPAVAAPVEPVPEQSPVNGAPGDEAAPSELTTPQPEVLREPESPDPPAAPLDSEMPSSAAPAASVAEDSEGDAAINDATPVAPETVDEEQTGPAPAAPEASAEETAGDAGEAPPDGSDESSPASEESDDPDEEDAEAQSAAPRDSPSRAPLPSDSELRQETRSLRQLFAEELATAQTSPEKTTVARELLRRAASEPKTSTTRYALLDLARQVALEANSYGLALSAIDKAAATFAVEGLQAKAAALEEAAKNGRGGTGAHRLVTQAFELFAQAVAAEDFALAQSLAALSSRVARRAKDPDLTKLTAAKINEAKQLAEMAELATAARATRKENRADETANHDLGVYLCFVRGQWDRGLRHLAKGSAGPLRTLAETERAGPTSAETCEDLGNQWAEQGRKALGIMRRNVFAHACGWYERAAKKSDGLVAVRARKEIELLAVNESIPEDSQATRQALFDNRGSRGDLVRVLLAAHCDDEATFFINGEQVFVCSKPAQIDLYLRPGDVITAKLVDRVAPHQGLVCALRGYDSPLAIVSMPGQVWKQYTPADDSRPGDPDGITNSRASREGTSGDPNQIESMSGLKPKQVWGDGNPTYLYLEVPSSR